MVTNLQNRWPFSGTRILKTVIFYVASALSSQPIIEWCLVLLPFILRDLVTLVLQSANWQLYRKAWHSWGYTFSERFDVRALFVLFTAT